MRVFVVSQIIFDKFMIDNNINDKNVEFKSNLVLISITDTMGYHSHYFKSNHKNVLNIMFDDIDEAELHTRMSDCKGMSVEQGKQIISFLETINKKKVKTIIVHCAAGISRSGAVGSFINNYFNLHYNQFKKDNPHIHPNSRVSMILNRLERGIEID